ncbi:hypothetical protein ABIE24_001429 [Mycetocola sp. 2940]
MSAQGGAQVADRRRRQRSLVRQSPARGIPPSMRPRGSIRGAPAQLHPRPAKTPAPSRSQGEETPGPPPTERSATRPLTQKNIRVPQGPARGILHPPPLRRGSIRGAPAQLHPRHAKTPAPPAGEGPGGRMSARGGAQVADRTLACVPALPAQPAASRLRCGPARVDSRRAGVTAPAPRKKARAPARGQVRGRFGLSAAAVRVRRRRCTTAGGGRSWSVGPRSSRASARPSLGAARSRTGR